MRSIAALSFMTSLVLAGTLGAQDSTIAAPCTAPHGPPVEQLQALARQYHPEAFTPENSRAAVLVAFVLDSECRVLHDVTGHRSSEGIDLVATLESLFPGVRIEPFVVAGIADAAPDSHLAGGRPWIVWAVVKT